MKNEQELIPYNASDLTGRRVLSLAPHPDDETIGCGGSLTLHVQAGDPVKVVFLTNGAKGDTSGTVDKTAYIALREMEAEKACKCFGIKDIEFWKYEDRGLASSKGKLSRLINLLNDFKPELVYVPSPLEFHPDHRAAAQVLQDAIQTCTPNFDVACYEVNQPLRVNVLVDITPVLHIKHKAIECYQSQLQEMPYDDISMSLNRFRSLTLAKEMTHAEGFSLWKSSLIKKIGFLSALSQNNVRLYSDTSEMGPLVSIIVRTKDRSDLLANAIKSVCRQTYANIELIVVNDGGENVEDVVRALSEDVPVTYITHEYNKGRSTAANTGLNSANGAYINFLDDDDILYPNHVETLVAWMTLKKANIAYSSVLSVYFEKAPYRIECCQKKELVYNIAFDPDRLLFQNYIPLMSIMFKKGCLNKAGIFDEKLSVFEDWDLLIRMSRHFTFYHIDKITAEYRFYGAENITHSHQNKYEYEKNQAEMFNRIIPYLNGNLWIYFLKSPFIDLLKKRSTYEASNPQILADLQEKIQGLGNYLGEISKNQDRMINNGSEIARKIEELLVRDHTIVSNIENSDNKNGEPQKILDEIYSSKAWKCIQFYRSLQSSLKTAFSKIQFKKKIKETDVFPEVSIVIPVYNGEIFIEKCLNSALEQSFSNIEIVIVDDCSTDNSSSIIKSFIQEDERIVYIQNDNNLGLVKNWNKCIEHTRGKWIKFLFQDDLLYPNCIETMLQASEAGADGVAPRFIVGERDFVIEDGAPEILKNCYKHYVIRISDIIPKTIISPYNFSDALMKAGLGTNFIGEPSSVMLHRDIFYDYSLFNTNLIQLCDLEYWTRIGTNERLAYTPEIISSFRVHKNSVSALNHAENSLQVNFLDKAILLQDYLFNPLYSRFRKAISSNQPLKQALKDALNQSLEFIQHSNDPNDKASFNEVISKYPILKSYLPKEM